LIHANFIEDTKGDLVNIDWYCSPFCFNEDMQDKGEDKDSYGHAYPCGTETDNDTYCANPSCGDLLWTGLSNTEY